MRVRFHRSVPALLVTLLVLALSGAASAQTLEIWGIGWNPNLIQWFQEVAAPAYKARTGWDIQLTNLGWDEFEEKVSVAGAAGVGPDVLATGGDMGLGWGRNGWLLPLNQYFERWDEADGIVPGLMRPDPATGEIWALPLYVDLRGTAYNKRLFREAGLDPEQAPQSWEELESAAQRLTRIINGELRQIGMDEHWADPGWGTMQVFTQYLYSYNEGLYSEDYREINWDGPKGVETAEFIARMYQMSHPPHAEDRVEDRYAGFMNGTVAMTHGGSWIGRDAHLHDPAWREDLGFFIPQRSPAYEKWALSFANGIAISRFSRDPDQAWDLLSWLMSRDVNPEFLAKHGSVSSRYDAIDENMRLQPELAGWYAASAHAVLWPIDPHIAVNGLNALFDWGSWGQMLYDIYQGNRNAQAGLVEVGAAWQGVLDSAWAALGN